MGRKCRCWKAHPHGVGKLLGPGCAVGAIEHLRHWISAEIDGATKGIERFRKRSLLLPSSLGRGLTCLKKRVTSCLATNRSKPGFLWHLRRHCYKRIRQKHRIISPASVARFPDPAASGKDRLRSNYVSTPGAGRVSCDRNHTILNAITVIL